MSVYVIQNLFGFCVQIPKLSQFKLVVIWSPISCFRLDFTIVIPHAPPRKANGTHIGEYIIDTIRNNAH